MSIDQRVLFIKLTVKVYDISLYIILTYHRVLWQGFVLEAVFIYKTRLTLKTRIFSFSYH
jgi:hypothetical protein